MLYVDHLRIPFGQMLMSHLNQSQSGIYIDNGLGSAANTVIPANAGVTKDFAPSGCTY